MMMNTTLEQLRSLKLAGMATGLQEQLTQPGMTGMSFEERLALLVDREVHWRSGKRQARLLKAAHLKYPQACIEDIDTRAGRGLERSAVMSLDHIGLVVMQPQPGDIFEIYRAKRRRIRTP